MRALILAAGGMLGRDLVATAPADAAVVALARAELDITDGRALADVVTP